MSYETIKSFVLFLLVGISLFLSFILWSYQPNYEFIYDASYVNEVDVGGSERTKTELIQANNIVFIQDEHIFSFENPTKQGAFYKEMADWVLYEYRISDAKGKPDSDKYIEIDFPSKIPAELLTNIFTFNQNDDLPDWSFDTIYITFDDGAHTLQVTVMSIDERKQIIASIEKLETYEHLLSYFEEEKGLIEYVKYEFTNKPIYVPKGSPNMEKQTLVASSIKPDSFINALFINPNLVTPNRKEAYFTDGQRGMSVLQDGKKLEFINPVQSSFERLSAVELIDKSIHHINDHKGWTNDYFFDEIKGSKNEVVFRLYHDGYPLFDHAGLTIMEEEWKEQNLYQYNRPLISIGNVLNTQPVSLMSGETVIDYLVNNKSLKGEHIKDIRLGYYLYYLYDAHSLTLEPGWFVLYDGKWQRITFEEINDYFGEEVD